MAETHPTSARATLRRTTFRVLLVQVLTLLALWIVQAVYHS